MTMNIKDLVEKVSFKDAISQNTIHRPERTPDPMETVSLATATIDDYLTPEPDAPANRPPVPTPTPEPERDPDYDAEANARSLVIMLTGFDALLLTGVSHLKCRAAAGGGAVIKEMRQALTKELVAGAELTDHEKNLIAKFKEYDAKIKMLSGAVLCSPTEQQQMIDAAIPYCEESQLKIGAGFAFWTTYGSNLTGRVLKILMA